MAIVAGAASPTRTKSTGSAWSCSLLGRRLAMASVAKNTVGKAVVERVKGSQPGALRAFAAAAVVGIATAVLTYRGLRSGG